MSASFIYITTKDDVEATMIGKALVHERLAACVNIIGRMTSMYWWKGTVQENPETLVIAKTRQQLVEPLIERVKSLHSYDCPCVISWPILAGNTDYLNWIENETNGVEDIEM